MATRALDLGDRPCPGFANRATIRGVGRSVRRRTSDLTTRASPARPSRTAPSAAHQSGLVAALEAISRTAPNSRRTSVNMAGLVASQVSKVPRGS